MGCDIHMMVEYNHPKFGWINLACGNDRGITEASLGDWYLHRNYTVFYAIAKVRYDRKELEGLEPRGHPDDCTQNTRAFFEDDLDLHSHSHLSYKEFDDAIRPLGASKGGYHECLLGPVQLSYHVEEIERVRFVFAFDN